METPRSPTTSHPKILGVMTRHPPNIDVFMVMRLRIVNVCWLRLRRHDITDRLYLFKFNILMEVLHDMLDQIERQRLQKMMNEMPDHEAFENRWAISLTIISA